MNPSPANAHPDNKGDAAVNLLLPYILYMAFISGCLVYAGLIASGLLGTPADAQAAEFPIPLPLIFGVVSLMTIPIAVLIGRSMSLDQVTQPGLLFRGLLRRLILQAALFESIALYGLVGHILGMAAVPSLLFVGGSLFCLALLMPGLQREVDRIRMLQKQTGRET